MSYWRKNLQLPREIKCGVGGELKPINQYSKNQLQKYKDGQNWTDGPTCMQHTSQSAEELRCLGFCTRWLPLNAFSKATRRNRVYVCLECTQWILATEPGQDLTPPPNCQLSPDELHRLAEMVDGRHEAEEEMYDSDSGSEIGVMITSGSTFAPTESLPSHVSEQENDDDEGEDGEEQEEEDQVWSDEDEGDDNVGKGKGKKKGVSSLAGSIAGSGRSLPPYRQSAGSVSGIKEAGLSSAQPNAKLPMTATDESGFFTPGPRHQTPAGQAANAPEVPRGPGVTFKAYDTLGNSFDRFKLATEASETFSSAESTADTTTGSISTATTMKTSVKTTVSKSGFAKVPGRKVYAKPPPMRAQEPKGFADFGDESDDDDIWD